MNLSIEKKNYDFRDYYLCDPCVSAIVKNFRKYFESCNDNFLLLFLRISKYLRKNFSLIFLFSKKF